MNPGDIVPPGLRRYANGRLPDAQLAAVGEGEKLSAVAAQHFRRMDSAARAAGVDLRVSSGYRTYAEQSHFYDLYRSGRGNLAAPPGSSNHGWGLSVDLDVRGEARASAWLRANAARYGFFNDVSTEPWHWTYRPR
jgi:LAS superfamily LD-carboxypeptidase LdcB